MELKKMRSQDTFSIFEYDMPIDKSNYLEVFSACVGKVLANQIRCGNLVVNDQDWNVDFSEGIILFGDTSYPLQLIGTESHVSDTWLWGWANESPIPKNLLEEGLRLKSLGEMHDFKILTESQFNLDENINGHTLSMIFTALSDKKACYYRCPYEKGAAFILFYDLPDEVFQSITAKQFTDISLHALQEFSLDHKIFITNFLFQNSTPYQWKDNLLTAKFHNGEKLNILFSKIDESWKISEFKTLN